MAKKSSLKRRIISLGLAMVVMVAASVGAVWMALAALSGQVSSQFNVSYTAKNVIADVLCEYQQTGQELTTLGSASFDGTEKEENGNNVINFNSKDFVLNKATDTVEIYYTILNKATTYGFGVSLQVGGITDPNMSVKYSLEYNNGTTRPATNFNLTEVPTDMYLTESGTDTSCLLFAIQIGVLDPEKNATAENITMDFVLDSTAPQPAPKWTYGNVDIWNADSKTFNTNILNKLLQSITGDASTSLSNMAKIEKLATPATGYESYYYYGTRNLYAIHGKTEFEDYTVLTFGGLQWHPTVLSKDKSGNIILTIGMKVVQDAWVENVPTDGENYTFSDGILMSTFCAAYSAGWTVDYPAAMYGTSYIRAVTLNNGGNYAISSTELTTYEKSEDSVFAPFTMDEFGITKYIVTPRNVKFQEKQSLSGTASTARINSFWGDERDEYFNKNGYDVWADDYIWLLRMTGQIEYNVSNLFYGGPTTLRLHIREKIGSGSGSGITAAFRKGGNIVAVSGGYTAKAGTVPGLHLNLTKIAQDFGK